MIITAPGPARDGADAAIARLEGALAGFGGPKPGWFRAVERLGRWWYLIVAVVMAVCFAAFVSNGESAGMNVLYGLAFSPIATLVVVGAVTGAAHLQTLMTGRTGRDRVVKEVAEFARPAGGVVTQVEAILAADPGLAERVHEVAWRAAGVGNPDRVAAERELDELWRLADPEAAEERDAEIRRIEEDIEKLKRDGKLS
ncbi:hypothetical protein AB0B28_12345 [Glycomyces sp. NPDC046736]|uniref:hypothetical protein n=1 Tax=Glycomyces sp. NPDC046736 TaxID=3155615 RepID=UPI0033F07E1A